MQECFNQYTLIEQLTSKPLKSVYLAHRPRNVSQKVVLKIFDATCLNGEQPRERLLQKVKWMKQLRHEHIVPVLDVGIEHDQAYIVTAYQSSGSLRDRLDDLAPQRLALEEALPIVLQVGRTLRYVHQLHILHGNLKPENIFFYEQDTLLADFQLGDLLDVTKLNAQTDLHNSSYLAPEQSCDALSEKSDQYALACLTYELLTGRMPAVMQGFSSLLTKQHTQRTISLSDLIPDLPEQVEEVVLKAMAKDPSERYANISIFLRALESLSLLPTSASSSPAMLTLSSVPASSKIAEPVENLTTVGPVATLRLSEAPPATHGLEHSKSALRQHKVAQQSVNKTLPIPLSKPLETSPNSKKTPHTPSKSSETPPNSKTVQRPASHKATLSRAEQAHSESRSTGERSASRKAVAPTFWIAFALSGLVILMGVIMPYALAPFSSPGSHHSATPATVTLPASIKPQLSCSYTEQSNTVDNLTTEGTLDWMQWGLYGVGDVNRKLAVQQQISSFTPIGNGIPQRDVLSSNAYTWSDGTPVLVVPAQRLAGISMAGTNNGFTFTVKASTTLRTLRVYVGAYQAQGYFWAGINGRSFTDTTLDTRNSLKSGDNGIYTLIFSSSVPDQMLTVKYTLKTSYASNSAVMLEAATLQD